MKCNFWKGSGFQQMSCSLQSHTSNSYRHISPIFFQITVLEKRISARDSVTQHESINFNFTEDRLVHCSAGAMISSNEVGADITASSAWNTLMAPVIWSLDVFSNKGDFWCFWIAFVWKLLKFMGWFSFLCTFEYFPACSTWIHFCIYLFIVFW